MKKTLFNIIILALCLCFTLSCNKQSNSLYSPDADSEDSEKTEDSTDSEGINSITIAQLSESGTSYLSLSLDTIAVDETDLSQVSIDIDKDSTTILDSLKSADYYTNNNITIPVSSLEDGDLLNISINNTDNKKTFNGFVSAKIETVASDSEQANTLDNVDFGLAAFIFALYTKFANDSYYFVHGIFSYSYDYEDYITDLTQEYRYRDSSGESESGYILTSNPPCENNNEDGFVYSGAVTSITENDSDVSIESTAKFEFDSCEYKASNISGDWGTDCGSIPELTINSGILEGTAAASTVSSVHSMNSKMTSQTPLIVTINNQTIQAFFSVNIIWDLTEDSSGHVYGVSRGTTTGSIIINGVAYDINAIQEYIDEYGFDVYTNAVCL